MTDPDPQGPQASSPLSAVMWWVTLIISVIALPIIGASLALALSENATIQVLVFMMVCWLCTWAGMWLMRKANAAGDAMRDKR